MNLINAMSLTRIMSLFHAMGLSPSLLFLVYLFYLLSGVFLWRVAERASPGRFLRLPFLLLWPMVLIVSLFVLKRP